MIDFQKGGLEWQVFEAISKTYELVKSDDIPHFETKKLDDGKWECTLKIPGIEIARSIQDSEVVAINRCASNMLHILDCLDKRGIYDPENEESVFREDIESYFGEVDYDPEYNYYLFTGDILFKEDDEYAKKFIKSYSRKYYGEISEQGDEIDRICDFITVRYLVKQKKKNYC